MLRLLERKARRNDEARCWCNAVVVKFRCWITLVGEVLGSAFDAVVATVVVY